MFGQHFYNKHIRNTVIAFGTVFNNVNIKRLDSSGNPLQNIRVPLAYAPKEKMLVRLEQQEDLRGDDSKVAVTLPRMSFDIQSFSYDPSRKLNKNLKFGKVKASGDTKKLNTQYAPVPYDIGFNLYAFVANSDDGLQILEQILPYFQPDYTVTMIESTTMGVNRDIPFILESVDYEDTYTGNFDNRRAIIYTLKFTAKVYLYGPIGSSSVVRKVGVDLYENVASTNPSRKERITITPNPTSADYDDDYTFTTTTEFFDDGKNYDEVSGDDK